MSFLLVPHGVTETTAEVWVGATGEADAPRRAVAVEYGEAREELEPGGWSVWESYTPTDPASYPPLDRLLHRLLPQAEPVLRTLHHRRVTLEGLEPRTTYPLRLLVDGRPVEGPLGGASVRTLPPTLPGEGERPFTLLLGSCFYGPEDREGAVGRVYGGIPEAARPDVKVLCGDQVYLDNPWRETTFEWYLGNRKPGVFRAMLFDKYVANWTQTSGGDGGFRSLLADGGNYFCSDDHEFWNNAPNFGGVGFLNTITRAQRAWWLREAGRLFRAFQAPRALQGFEVPPLSVRIADTRINRDPAGRRFMDEVDLGELERWVGGLGGPGVLVLGQPVLVEGTDLRTTLSRKGLAGTVVGYLDRNLPDYDQYDDLIRIIRSSDHSVVLLSGDVHFGRVAEGPIRPGTPARLVEVISSPMQAVLDEGKRPLFGRYADAPTDRFPGLRSRPVLPERNHFATVEFNRDGGGVRMTVRAWPVPPTGGGRSEGPQTVYEDLLT